MEYYFKQLTLRDEEPRAVEVSKFDGGDAPIAVYRVEIYCTGRMACDCPAGSHYRKCKHLDMVRKWDAQNTEPDAEE